MNRVKNTLPGCYCLVFGLVFYSILIDSLAIGGAVHIIVVLGTGGTPVAVVTAGYVVICFVVLVKIVTLIIDFDTDIKIRYSRVISAVVGAIACILSFYIALDEGSGGNMRNVFLGLAISWTLVIPLLVFLCSSTNGSLVAAALSAYFISAYVGGMMFCLIIVLHVLGYVLCYGHGITDNLPHSSLTLNLLKFVISVVLGSGIVHILYTLVTNNAIQLYVAIVIGAITGDVIAAVFQLSATGASDAAHTSADAAHINADDDDDIGSGTKVRYRVGADIGGPATSEDIFPGAIAVYRPIAQGFSDAAHTSADDVNTGSGTSVGSRVGANIGGPAKSDVVINIPSDVSQHDIGSTSGAGVVEGQSLSGAAGGQSHYRV